MPECLRCGTCCAKGGPALHTEDLPLVREGVLPLDALVVIRAGETAHDQVTGRLAPLEAEIVKVWSGPWAEEGPEGGGGRGASVWTCPYLRLSPEGGPEEAGDLAACAVHARRPLECRLLDCRDTAALARAYDKDRLTRRDILPEAFHELLDEHDRVCGAARLEALRRACAGGESEACGELDSALAFDAAMRHASAQRGLEGLLPLLFGREPRA